MMRFLGLFFLLSIFSGLPAGADVTIVQRVEGVGPTADMTIKIKGDKARIDATPQLTTIIDGKTGEMTTLMHDQKTLIRVSAAELKAAAEMFNQDDGKNADGAKPKLTSTGKKETINGYETEEYVCETPLFKASYWVAPKYPDGPAILKQLQSLKSEMWNPASANMPDYRDFPGLPIRTVVTMGSNQVTSTLTSVKQGLLSDAEFSVPKDFQKKKASDIGSLLGEAEEKPAVSSSPKP